MREAPPGLDERSRRTLFTIALVLATTYALIVSLGRLIPFAWPYLGDHKLPGLLGRIDGVVWVPVAIVGVFSIFVLTLSFTVHGKASLSRRSRWWWLGCAAFVAINLAGHAAEHLPWVDHGSSVEDLFKRIERDMRPLALFIPLAFALFLEGGVRLAGDPTARRTWMPWVLGGALASGFACIIVLGSR